MRKSNKSDLAKLLTKRVISLENPLDQSKYAIDGGARLHRVRWIKNCSYGDVIDQHRNELQTKFGNVLLSLMDIKCLQKIMNTKEEK